MAARDIPITTIAQHLPVGRITITDEHFEHWASKGMQFVISPVLVAKHGTDEHQVIEFTLRALGSEPAPKKEKPVIGANHPARRNQ